MADINRLLDRLDRVKQLPPRKHAQSYIALCSSHNDRHPSLCVDLTRDGRILIYCRAGCSATDVLASIGLTTRDLFPEDSVHGSRGPPIKEVELARTILQIARADISAGKALGKKDIKAIRNARSMISQYSRTST